MLWDGSCVLNGAHRAQSWDTLRFRIKPECPVKPIFPFFILFSFFSQILASSQESAWDGDPGRSSQVPRLHPDCGQAAESRQEDAPVFSSSLIQGATGHRLCWDTRGLGWFSGGIDLFTSQRKSLLLLPLITGINPSTILSAESSCPSISVKEGRN